MDKNKLFHILTRIVIPAIGIALSIWATFFLRANRELSFEVTSKTEFQAIKSDGWPDIKLFYGDRLLDKAGLITIKLINTGNTPIYSSEFVGPVSLKLETGSRFVASRVVETQPKNLNPRISTSDASVMIEPLLLNPNDAISLQVLVGGNINSLNVNARVGGIKELTDLSINKAKTAKRFSWILVVYSLICFAGYSLLAPVILRSKRDPQKHILSRRGGILIGAIMVLSGTVSFVFFNLVNSFAFGWLYSFFFNIFFIMALLFIGAIVAIPFQYKQSMSQETEE